MVAFAGLPSFTVLLLWVAEQGALSRTAAVASPSLYNMPPFQFDGLDQLQTAVQTAVQHIRDAAEDIVLPEGLEMARATGDGDQRAPARAPPPSSADGGEEDDSLAMFRRPVRSDSDASDSDTSGDGGNDNGAGQHEDSSSGSDTVAADSDAEDDVAGDGGATHDGTLLKLRAWLDAHGPRTPMDEDHLLRPLHWLPRRGTELVSRSRRRPGQPTSGTDARAVLWTWRALDVSMSAAAVSWLEQSKARATPAPAEQGEFSAEQEAAAEAERAGLESVGAPLDAAPEAADDDPEDEAGPMDDVEALRRDRERLSRALQARQQGRPGRAVGDGAPVAAAELPEVVVPTILVPDTNVFLNVRHWAVLEGIISGEWMQGSASSNSPSLAVAVPLIGALRRDM